MHGPINVKYLENTPCLVHQNNSIIQILSIMRNLYIHCMAKCRASNIKARDIYNENVPLRSQVRCGKLGKIANYALGKCLVSIWIYYICFLVGYYINKSGWEIITLLSTKQTPHSSCHSRKMELQFNKRGYSAIIIEDTLIWKRKLWIALCGELVLEEALDLS
jgi:hypothetical protein